MEHLTWAQLRKVLVEIGDNAEVMDQEVVLTAEGEWNIRLVIDATKGTLGFVYSFSPED